MNGFNNWRGLKRPFHNYCLPRLDYSSTGGWEGVGGWQSMDESWNGLCGVGHVPFVNAQQIKGLVQ